MTNKYAKAIRTELVDVYDILEAFNVYCPATQHAIKKLLMPGKRGNKGTLQDLMEARVSINRAIELEEARCDAELIPDFDPSKVF